MKVENLLFIILGFFYIMIFLVSAVELLYSYILSKKGKLQLSFRLAFLLLVLVLCVIRVLLIALTLYLARMDAFAVIQTNVILIAFGNFFFFCAFYSVVLLFIRALKIQTGRLVSIMKRVNYFITGTHAITQLVFSLTVMIQLAAEQDALEATIPDFEEGVTDELPLLALVSKWVFALITTIIICNAIFTFLLSVGFLILGIKVWQGLRDGSKASQNQTDHSFTKKLTLVNKMLILTLIVSVCLIAKGVYGFYIVSNSDVLLNLSLFDVDFLTEVIPLITFQLVLYLSRREINSSKGTGSHSHSHSHSQSQSHTHGSYHSPHSSHHPQAGHKEVSPEHGSTNQLLPSSIFGAQTSPAEPLNANEWLKVLKAGEAAAAAMNGEKIELVEREEEEEEHGEEKKKREEKEKKEREREKEKEKKERQRAKEEEEGSEGSEVQVEIHKEEEEEERGDDKQPVEMV